MSSESGQRAKIPWWVYDALADRKSLRVQWITGGLGSGKSHGGQIWDVKRCIENGAPMSEVKPTKSWTVAPNYLICDTLMELTLQVAQDVFGLREGKHFKLYLSSPLTIDFTPMKIRHELSFRSADNPKHFVSASLTHWRWSEPGVSKQGVFKQLMDRLRDKRGKVLQGLADGTPEGMDNEYAELADIPGTGRVRFNEERNFSRYILETGDNAHNLVEGYVDSLRDRYRYDTSKLLSYEKGLFVRFDKGSAYWEFKESRNVVSGVEPSPNLPLALTFDFNVAPLAFVTCQEFTIQKNYLAPRTKQYVALTESSGESRGLMDAIAEFASQYPVHAWSHVPIYVYGDASGHARNIHNSAGSDYKAVENYLRALGYQKIEVRAVKSNPLVKHRLEKTSALMAYERFAVNSTCRRLIESFNKTSLVEGTFEIDKPTGETWTHYADACTYYLFQEAKDIDVANPRARRIIGTS